MESKSPKWMYLLSGVEPYSVNSCYRPIKGNPWRTYLTREGKALKAALLESFILSDKTRGKPAFEYYNTTIALYIPKIKLYFKGSTTKLQGWDPSNYIKLIEDALFEHIGKDDCYDLSVTSQKFISIDNLFHIQISIESTVLESKLPNDLL